MTGTNHSRRESYDADPNILDAAAAWGLRMDMSTYLILDRIYCQCEALCTCSWEDKFIDEGVDIPDSIL